MARSRKSTKAGRARSTRASRTVSKLLKTGGVQASARARKAPREIVDVAVQNQLKHYDEAQRHFQQQKLHRAKQSLEKVLEGPSKELCDRARIHLRICEQRISRAQAPTPKGAEEFYTQGIAMMNLGRWDEAREHLDRARKAAPKADHIVYAMAALDCLTGEAESAMDNLKLAIQLRPENRYHARNDEDFAFLQEDPRFTELLYPEGESASG